MLEVDDHILSFVFGFERYVESRRCMHLLGRRLLGNAMPPPQDAVDGPGAATSNCVI